MMKFLLLLVVGVVVAWMFMSRRRGPPPSQPKAPPRPAAAPPAPARMLACAHCGLHLPQADTLTGSDERAYCSEAHRLAGPR